MGEGWEFKVTWSKAAPEDRWYWMNQFRAYAYMTGSHTTNLVALYLLGTVRGGPPMPRLVGVRYRWSDADLAQTWISVLSGYRQMVKESADVP